MMLNSEQRQQMPAMTVDLLGPAPLPLTAHQVPEASGAEGHKTEVEGIQVAQPLQGGEKHGGPAHYQQDLCSQYQGHRGH